MGKKRRKERANVVFDEKERREFLTGFQKRKAERKLKAKEKLAKQLLEEKLAMREMKRERMKKLYENQPNIPELEHLIEEPIISYELPQHFVNITSFDTIKMGGKLGMTMGVNEGKIDEKEDNDGHDDGDDVDNDGEDNDIEDEEESVDMRKKILETQRDVKNDRIKAMKASKALQTVGKQRKKKDLGKSKLKKKMIKRELNLNKNKNFHKTLNDKKKGGGKRKGKGKKKKR